MKPRLGKKGRKALAAAKAAKPKKKAKAKAVKPQTPAPEPQAPVEPPPLSGPPAMPGDADYVEAPAPEGDGCAVGGSESEAGPEFNPA